MNRKHSIFYIATQWMQNNKPCIHGKGQRCIWIESSKECQDCMMAERTMVKKGDEQREMNKGKTGKNLLFSKKEYYKFQLAILIVILIFLVMALSAEGQTFRGDDNRQYSNMMQIIMSVSAGLLGYIAWTVRRFVRKVDNMQCFLSKAVKILITIATEHRSNHDSCVNFDELIKSEDGSV